MIDRDEAEQKYRDAKASTKAWAVAKPWVAMACSFVVGFLAHMLLFS